MTISQIGSYLKRTATNESFRKGLMSAAAGVIIAAICEAVWPSA